MPFLAAAVGLIALAGAVLVEFNAQERATSLSQELARMRLTIDLLSQRNDALAAAADSGVAEALLALQARMDALESEWGERQVSAGGPVAASDPGSAAATAPATINPDLPTEDCIPIGTRFMATPGDSYAICQSPAVVRITAITGDNVAVEGAGVIAETGFGNLAGTNCTIMVFSADIEGFAELRVSCS